jgi:hypothetical protein
MKLKILLFLFCFLCVTFNAFALEKTYQEMGTVELANKRYILQEDISKTIEKAVESFEKVRIALVEMDSNISKNKQNGYYSQKNFETSKRTIKKILPYLRQIDPEIEKKINENIKIDSILFNRYLKEK